MRPDDVTRNSFLIWWESYIVPTSILDSSAEKESNRTILMTFEIACRGLNDRPGGLQPFEKGIF